MARKAWQAWHARQAVSIVVLRLCQVVVGTRVRCNVLWLYVYTQGSVHCISSLLKYVHLEVSTFVGIPTLVVCPLPFPPPPPHHHYHHCVLLPHLCRLSGDKRRSRQSMLAASLRRESRMDTWTHVGGGNILVLQHGYATHTRHTLNSTHRNAHTTQLTHPRGTHCLIASDW